MEVSPLGCASIYKSPGTCLLFPFHKTDHSQHHDEVFIWFNGSYLMNILANRRWLTPLLSDLGLCMNGFVSFIKNVKFQEHIAVYQDESGISLTQSILACSLVSIHDLLAVAHTLQVSFSVDAIFWMLALIPSIVVVAGWELMWWLHWKVDFT